MGSTPTIDADGHVNETGHLDEYIDPAYKHLLALPPWELQERMAPDFGPMETWDPEVFGILGLAGGHDPRARLVDMDAEGIDQAVLYPTMLLNFRPDPAEFGALCRAYNDWLRDYCSAAPNRLYGVALVPLQDPKAAIAEMERAVQELEFKAVMIRPAPYIELRKLHDPVYDPFWDAASSLGCPVGVHPF